MNGIRRLFFALTLLLLCRSAVQADEGHLFTSRELSSTHINSIVQDGRGYIWIGTEYGLNKFDGYHFTTYLNHSGDPHSLCHNNVQTLFVDSQGRLWVGTVKGLARYDSTTDDFHRYRLRQGSDDQPRIAQMTESPEGSILVGTSGFGLYEITQQTDTAAQTHRYSSDDLDDYYPVVFFDPQGRFWKADNNGVISCFSADRHKPTLLLRHPSEMGKPYGMLLLTDGEVLVCTSGGGIRFHPATLKPTLVDTDPYSPVAALVSAADRRLLVGTAGRGLFSVQYNHDELEPLRISNRLIDFATAHVSAICEDRQHNLWIGCNQRGLFFLPMRQPAFSSWSLNSEGVKTGSVLSSVCEGSDGTVWACLKDGSLYQFDRRGHIVRTIATPAGQQWVYRDHQGTLWSGAASTLYRFDEPTGRLQAVRTFDGEQLQCMADDGRGTLFLSTFSKGLTVYDTKTHAEHRFSMYQTDAPRGFLCNDWVMALHYDRSGLVWAATSSGTSCYDPVHDSFSTFGWHNLLEGYTCLTIDEDTDGNILIGTDRGLFRFVRRANKLEPFPTDGRLTDKIINSIVCCADGDVWCSTSDGLWHYHKADSIFVQHVGDDGLREREYTQGVGVLTADGRIIFGNSDGLVAFTPQSIPHTTQAPASPTLTRMLIGSRVVTPRPEFDGHSITPLPVDQSKTFSLSYLDNTFSMEFSNFDHASAANIALEYRLNSDPWMLTGIGHNTVTFNRLQPGTYRLYVRTVQSGCRSDTQAYTLIVRAPWYRTTLAYLFYILLLLVVVGCASWTYYRRRQRQLAEEKMQFLINATHDIRTPLTLILSPLHQLMKRKTNDAETAEKLGIIDHNARRILTLVNQILDIRKIDKLQMQLQCEQMALVPYINNICKVFEAHAAERGITFRFEHEADVEAAIDRVQFDKVVQNLLSNAFKFTPNGGEITLCLIQDEPQTFTITVTDTGTGISAADLPHIFTRFYQSSANRAIGKEGTGIGLNLCKKIVEMHHGTLTAANRTDGRQGSVFTVTMKTSAKRLSTNGAQERSGARPLVACKARMGTEVSPRSSYRILLVDDDAEITDYIASELSDYYHFGICNNGREALSALLSGDKHYDLVVSDIMMPEMDGFTLLRTIKSNLTIAYTPVILLTTEAAVGNRLEGLQRGADAFMPKPFIVEELHMQIDNLLAKSQRLKQKFSGVVDEQVEKVEQRDVSDTDQQLMNRIVQSVNKNLSDGDFTIEQLAAEVGLSRSQLHRRMKELTGLSASDFVRNIRLEQAARLLRERKANISQVAYSVGFNSPGTFSKVFRQHFGQSPTEYAAQGE